MTSLDVFDDDFDDEELDDFEAELEDDDDLSEFDDDLSGLDNEDDPIEKHNEKVDRSIAALRSRKAPTDVRVEAALWLGESGEPRAITTLRRAYQKDKDKAVQRAAKEALGQFKALQIAMESDDEDDQQLVNDLLEGVILDGKRGKRLGVRPGTLWAIQGVLLIVGMALLGAGLLLGGSGGGTVDPPAVAAGSDNGDAPAAPTLDPNDLLAIYAQLNQQHQSLTADATLLSTQVREITQGFGQDCDLEAFIQTQPYSLPAGFDNTTNVEIATAVAQFNAIQSDFSTIANDLRQSCNTQIPLSSEQALAHLDSIIADQRELVALPELWADVDLSSVPTPTPEPSATPEPTATHTPIPTVDPAALREQITALDFIIDDMITGVRSKNALILQYWRDVQSAGSTLACNDTAPSIPADFVLPNNPALENAPPQLATAVQQVNLGLQLSRQSWDLFFSSCNSEALGANATTGLSAAEAAQTSFEQARNSLDQIRSLAR